MAGDLQDFSNLTQVHIEMEAREPTENGELQIHLGTGELTDPTDDSMKKLSTDQPTEKGKESNCDVSKDISALYGLMAIVSAMCITPLSEVVQEFDGNFLRWTETVNFVIAIAFLVFCFVFLFRSPTSTIVCGPASEMSESPSVLRLGKLKIKRLFTARSAQEEEVCVRLPIRQHLTHQVVDSGSLYLKVGCMIFAVGSLIYVCVILGIVIENYECFDTVMSVNPVLQMFFVSLQLLFIFRNSQFTITKYQTVGRLGLMHLVVLNLLICVRVMVDETIHEFAEMAEHNALVAEGESHANSTPPTGHGVPKKEVKHFSGTGAYLSSCVDEGSIMKNVLNRSTTFLYPCIIEYGLISAGIIFTMWRGVGYTQPATSGHEALGGLFAGLILVVVVVVVGLIVFFMAISNPAWEDIGVLDWHIMDIGLNTLGLFAVCYCGYQFATKLRRIDVLSVNMQLDDSLLMFSMIGVYAYCAISLLGTSKTKETNLFCQLSRTGAVLTIIQTTLQTIFLFDASKRGLKGQQPGKGPQRPGKQVLTFLLILNFALWAVNVFCALRTDGTPNQRDFYGYKGWTVLIHVTVPLMIFYRFHSTACIFEVWKRAYREPKQIVS